MPPSKKRKRRRSPNRPTSVPPGMRRVQPPKARLKTLLQLLVDMPISAEQAMLAVPLPEDETEKRLLMFDVSILLRASNALKAIRLLCEHAHWEFAAATVRQLFELVLNMEYIGAQPDREESIFLYAKYGLLQNVRRHSLDLRYEQKTGRPIDETLLAMLDSMLEQSFPEFRSVDSKGKVHWRPSWSGHSARYLADQSDNSLRVDQYLLMYASWSEQAHGAPSALIDNMFLRELPVGELVADDDARIAETISSAVSLFIELWMLLPNVPQINPQLRLDWLNRLIIEARRHGAPPPPT